MNSQQVVLPFSDSFYGYKVVENGDFLVLSTKFGVVVRYDGNSVISVGIPDNYKENVEGTKIIA